MPVSSRCLAGLSSWRCRSQELQLALQLQESSALRDPAHCGVALEWTASTVSAERQHQCEHCEHSRQAVSTADECTHTSVASAREHYGSVAHS